MYQLTNLLEEVNCDTLEYAYLTEREFHDAECFKLWIPKVMSPMPFGSATGWSEGIGNIYENDGGCKVSVGSTIPFQNYVIVYRHLDKDFSMRAEPDQKLPVGQQFIITCMNHDPRDKKIIQIM